MRLLRRLLMWILPTRSNWVAYVCDGSPAIPETAGLQVMAVGPNTALSPEQRGFLESRISVLSLTYLLRWHKKGLGWLFFVKSGDDFAHYAFVTPARRYARYFPMMNSEEALLIGPCFTEPEFRGRSIYPRVLQYIVTTLRNEGFGPFYIHTSIDNKASIRGMEKAGFRQLARWTGIRAICGTVVSGHLDLSQ